MKEISVINAYNVSVSFNGNHIFHAENMNIKITSTIHRVRSCFHNEDIKHIKTVNKYTASFTGLVFSKPVEQYNFYDLDDFTTEIKYNGKIITLKGCMWSDFSIASDKARLRENVSIDALSMETGEYD